MTSKRKRGAFKDPSLSPSMDTGARTSKTAKSSTPAVDGTPDPASKSKRTRTVKSDAQSNGASSHTIQDICRSLFESIRYYKDESGRLLSEPYLQLPPRTQFPDYDEVIAKPIAMNSIQAKIEHNKYKTVDAFYFEMDLVFENAKTYNQPQSRIYRDAVSLQQRFRNEFQNIMNQSRMGNGEDSAVDGKENPRKSGKATKKDMEKLFTAIENNDMKTIKSLLPKIDVNVLTETNLYGSKFSWAPLHAAAYFGQSDVVEQLIAHGADIELSDKWYHSKPLGWAAYGGNFETSQLLVEKYHADTTFRNIGDQTALDMVSETDDPRWKKLLSQAPARGRKRKSAAEDEGDGSSTDVPTPSGVKRSRKSGGSAVPAAKPDEGESGTESMKVKIKIPAAAKTPKIEHSALPAKKVPATGRIGGGEPFIDIEDISDDEEQETRPKSAATPAPVLPTFAVPAPIPPRKQIPPSLVTSLGLVSNDDHIRLILPVPTSATHHSLTIPSRVRSLNLRVLLVPSPLQYSITGNQITKPGEVGMRRKELVFKAAGKTVWDCLVAVEDGVNAFEFVVMGTVPQQGVSVVQQRVCLFMNRV